MNFSSLRTASLQKYKLENSIFSTTEIQTAKLTSHNGHVFWGNLKIHTSFPKFWWSRLLIQKTKSAIIFTSYSIYLKNRTRFKVNTSKSKGLDVITLWTNNIGQPREKMAHNWAWQQLLWTKALKWCNRPCQMSHSPLILDYIPILSLPSFLWISLFICTEFITTATEVKSTWVFNSRYHHSQTITLHLTGLYFARQTEHSYAKNSQHYKAHFFSSFMPDSGLVRLGTLICQTYNYSIN